MSKNFLKAVLLALGLVSAAAVVAVDRSPDGVWRDVDEAAVLGRGPDRVIVPVRYRTVALDAAQLRGVLAGAPAESIRAAASSDQMLSLPLPEGGYARFRIVASPIMAPGLAAKFPHIQTYLGQGVDDPTATLRFDVTPAGFHAQILSASGTRLIDPYQRGDLQHYISYHKRDYSGPSRMTCGVGGEEFDSSTAKGFGAKVSSGTGLRTYRLAMAATGEYTAFHGGSVADAMSAIVTTMNRVNGIYERELSVRMVLIDNNDLIIYTNGGSDPYTNDDGFAMLGENNSNLGAVIGNANFDVGHVVSTGGGGVASLASVCSASKAQGVTGSSGPIGDAFDVDYVAHEMGHQFAGSHTFNGTLSACSGNRSSSSAYEPGSGLTIQAYAGICGSENLQPNSEDYFHRRSLNQMLAFTTSAGSGASCGQNSATGNTPPTVSTTASFNIPRQTPFVLTASGSDTNGDTLSYLWEQFDLGSTQAGGQFVDTGNGPLFRSFVPMTEPTRIFPSLRYILNNANAVPLRTLLEGETGGSTRLAGELLPSTARTLNFRVTVRDNRAGGGGTNEASAAVVVSAAAGPFVVTAPNTAVSIAAGASTTVTWNVANTTAAPISTSQVDIDLSLDGGYTWPTRLVSATANDGSQSVTIPANTGATVQARVRVSAVGNIYFDISDANFTITGANTPPTITVTGEVSTSQGAPETEGVVATVNDVQDPAGNLLVSVAGAPPELAVSASNAAGQVSLAATAQCSLVSPSVGTKIYPLQLTTTDSLGGTARAQVLVRVGPNLKPEIGSYGAVNVFRSASTQAMPSVPASDPNANLDSVSISPMVLPGGGTVSIDSAGTVSVSATAASTLGTHPFRVRLLDSCGAEVTEDLSITVAVPPAAVTLTPTDGTTHVSENGVTDGYSLVLDHAPSGTVTITLNAGAQVMTDVPSLEFTVANWNMPQTMTVSAVDDGDIEGLHFTSITHSATGGGYTGVSIANASVMISDNDFDPDVILLDGFDGP